MSTRLDEPIKVGVIFGCGKTTPVWFLWRNRRYEIREVTMRWQTREGEARLLHLSVTDGTNDFELVLNQHTLSWRLAFAGSGSGAWA